ncbi:MAG: hypothetical protein ACE5EX_01995 [Phycisphaerae bacterium]
MAIRFLCQSCGQPIEIDDEWAGKTVACPYCRTTVTAPHETTLDRVDQIPTASPVAPEASPPSDSAWTGGDTIMSAPPRNTIATVALGLALGTVLLITISAQLMSAHRLEMEEMQEQMAQSESWGEQMRAMSEYYESSGGQPPAWMIGLSVLLFATCLTWAASLVCGIIGLRRPFRRGRAVAAVAIAGLLPVLFCCGGAMFGSGG